MASFVPTKSQPLHNFELPPLLKWSKDGKSSGSHKRRRSMKSPPPQRPSASPIRYSPLRDYATASPPHRCRSPSPDKSIIARGDSTSQTPAWEGMKRLAIGGDSETLTLLREEALRCSRGGDWCSESEAARKGKGPLIEFQRNQLKKTAFCSSNSEEGKLVTKSRAAEVCAVGIKKCNLSIKIGSKSSKQEEENLKETPLKVEINEKHHEIDESEKERKTNNKSDEDIRLWNLRPRSIRSKSEKAKFGGEIKVQPQLRNKSGGKEGKSGGAGGEKKEKCEKHVDKEKGEKKEKKKLSVSIALTKEEIEEDIFALTGSKPSRRPKKRPKNVQKQLDMSFPGLWLVSITPESYKVSENSLKG